MSKASFFNEAFLYPTLSNYFLRLQQIYRYKYTSLYTLKVLNYSLISKHLSSLMYSGISILKRFLDRYLFYIADIMNIETKRFEIVLSNKLENINKL